MSYLVTVQKKQRVSINIKTYTYITKKYNNLYIILYIFSIVVLRSNLAGMEHFLPYSPPSNNEDINMRDKEAQKKAPKVKISAWVLRFF